MTLNDSIANWKNEDAYNNAFHATLTDLVNADPLLKSHRDWVESNQHGFGDRAFHYVWRMLVDEIPNTFSFLEVGVFKGQVLSLVALLAKVSGKHSDIEGVSTLTNTRDVRCQYPEGDYVKWIMEIHKAFEVEQPTIRVGLSNDEDVLRLTAHPWNMIYIDGSHDYETVVQDLNNYGPRVALGGFFIVDDASGSEDGSFKRLNVGSSWPGLADVARAVSETLDKDQRFKFLFACGHLNVFRRVE